MNPKAEALLDAAERVWFHYGDLGLTVRRVTKEGATTSQTVYTHWGSMPAMIHAMVNRAVAGVACVLANGDVPGRTPDERNVLLSGWIRYCLEHPARFQMMERRGPIAGFARPEALDVAYAHLVALVGDPGGVARLHGEIRAMLSGWLPNPLDQEAGRG
jgi:AcrR family transcriptional regulator